MEYLTWLLLILPAPVIFALVALIAVLFVFLVNVFNQTQTAPSSSRRNPTKNELRKEFIKLLYGDVAAGERLLNHYRQRYPGKSETWYLEKAIGDLDRDRYHR